jgi:hypothetical protein
MVIEFEEALKVAKDCATNRTGDENPIVLRFERQENFLFQFRTTKGDLNIIVDPYGEVGHCFGERPSEEEETITLTRQDAVSKALDFLGEGKVAYIKSKSGGYEVEIEREKKGPVDLFVDKEGMVHRQKCTALTRNPELDV